MPSAICFNLDQPKVLSSGHGLNCNSNGGFSMTEGEKRQGENDSHQHLTHALIHNFETVPNSKKLQTTIEMWLLKDFKIQFP